MDCEDLVSHFYKALAAADIEGLRLVLSAELDWWFHGPPLEQHLMRMLTGADRLGSFSFVPLRMDPDIGGDKVIVEGHGISDDGKMFSWVHVWSSGEKQLTHLREYYDTSVTVSSSTHSKEFGRGEYSKRLPGLVIAV